MTRPRLRLWITSLAAAAIVATVIPAATALALTPSVTTIVASDLTVDRGDVITYTVVVLPAPGSYGEVTFESSADGSTWLTDQVLTQWDTTDNTLKWTAPVDGSVALGERHIRARFQGVNDIEGSTSDPIVQTVGIRQGDVYGLAVKSNSYPVIVPGTTPVEVFCWLTGAGGTIVFEQLNGATWDELGRTTLSYPGPNSGTGGEITLPGFALGSYELRARLLASDYTLPDEQEITFTMTKDTRPVHFDGPSTVQAHHEVAIYAGIEPPNTGVQTSATMTLTDADTDQVLAMGPNSVVYTTPSLPLGVHHFTGSFAGDGNYEATTGSLTVTVIPDVVEASGVGLSPATFYPYKDGYRDTTSISGSRNEPASVAITIYSPKGAVVRRASIPVGTGHYAWAWNGKSISGAAQAAGKYKVVQKLTDGFGSTKSVISYVTISKKRIYSHTVTITKTVSQATRRSSSLIGWSFTLPSATVYKSLVLSVYGQNTSYVGSRGLRLGGWDFRFCAITAAWNSRCVPSNVALKGFGEIRWTSTTLSTTYDRHGHTVRGVVFATPGSSGKVSTVRLKVTYGVLK